MRALHISPVPLTHHELDGLSERISNAVLWAICHDRVDHLPLRIAGWKASEGTNQRYADKVVAEWRPGDAIRVQGFPFRRVPLLNRQPCEAEGLAALTPHADQAPTASRTPD